MYVPHYLFTGSIPGYTIICEIFVLNICVENFCVQKFLYCTRIYCMFNCLLCVLKIFCVFNFVVFGWLWKFFRSENSPELQYTVGMVLKTVYLGCDICKCKATKCLCYELEAASRDWHLAFPVLICYPVAHCWDANRARVQYYPASCAIVIGVPWTRFHC